MRTLCLMTIQMFLFSTVLSAQAQSPTPSLLRPSIEVEQRVESILSQMTLEEKIDLLGGVDGFFIRDVSRLKLPRFRMADGPIGVRNFGPATAMAGGIGLAASWNPALPERVRPENERKAPAHDVQFL